MRLNNIVSKVEQAVRPRHLGIGFVWAWIYCSFSTSALFAERGGSSINSDPSWLASAIAVSACLLALAFAWRRTNMNGLRPFAFAGAALMAAGTFCSGAFAVPEWASLACGVASGVGSALLILFWGDALSRIETDRVEIAVPAASCVMLACVFVFPYIQGLPGVCGVASLPLLSMLCLYLTWDDIDAGRFAADEEDGVADVDAHGNWFGSSGMHGKAGDSAGFANAAVRPASGGGVPYVDTPRPLLFLVRISIVLFAAYFAIGTTSAMGGAIDEFQAAYGFDAGTFFGSACGVGLAFWFIFFSPRVNVSAVLRWLSPLLVVGLAAMSFSGALPAFATCTAVSVADTMLQVVAFLSLVNLVRRGVFSAAFAVGVGQGVIQLGVLAGNLFGNWSSGAIAAGQAELWMVSLAAICVLSIAMTASPFDVRLEVARSGTAGVPAMGGRAAGDAYEARLQASGVFGEDDVLGAGGISGGLSVASGVQCRNGAGSHSIPSASDCLSEGGAIAGQTLSASSNPAESTMESSADASSSQPRVGVVACGAPLSDSASACRAAQQSSTSRVEASSWACSVVPTDVESLDMKVARIAAAGGLSVRETEVLGYLARGRSQPYIRDALVLSKNTVASHVKHIYQKLDVHSRQELLDLFAQ